MGNGIEENNLRKINPEEIIENDCYEEIDLNKINKIIEKEKCWNKNSIIVSLNEFDLKKLNEDNVNIEDKKEKDKNNDEVVNDVIEEQKNEEGSEDGKKNEIKENGQIVNNEININKNENEEEKKEENEINKNDNYNEINKNEINNNASNDNANGIINISNQQDENKKEDVPKENNNEDNTKNNNTINVNNVDNENKNNNNNKNENNQVKGKIKNKVKGKKVRIRPKNTSDEALKGAKGKVVKKEKEKKNNNDKSQNPKDGNTNNKNAINNNEKEVNKSEKKTNNIPVEKKDPSEEFDIKNIISEYRINHLKDDEIIYSGTLDKILKIPDKNTIAYSQRFCIFTKKYFAYYKTKESYISLNKPMLLINNNFIIRIENTILDGGSYYFGIICEVNDETRSLINKVNSFVTNEANTCELLLGFRTNEYENMMKWVVILRYFISKQKEDF